LMFISTFLSPGAWSYSSSARSSHCLASPILPRNQGKPPSQTVSRLAWAGVLLGPAFLLLSALLWDDAGPLPLALAALAFVGGFVTLVSRLPARREDDDDDGAVV